MLTPRTLQNLLPFAHYKWGTVWGPSRPGEGFPTVQNLEGSWCRLSWKESTRVPAAGLERTRRPGATGFKDSDFQGDVGPLSSVPGGGVGWGGPSCSPVGSSRAAGCSAACRGESHPGTRSRAANTPGPPPPQGQWVQQAASAPHLIPGGGPAGHPSARTT